MGLFLSILLTIGAFLAWPFRMAWALVRRKQGYRKARIQRLIFLGLDGLDPRLTERYMAEGKLPNLSRLREMGSYSRLRTTYPALSPVAWSTFATGVSPAKHNIFDFLNRNLKSYLPELSSAKIRPVKRGRPIVEMRRKSQSFWKILGEHAIGSTILRVPVTFPPEKFAGRLLSAMCTPDLRGTQGSFSSFRGPVDQPFVGSLEGPDRKSIEFRLIKKTAEMAELAIAGESHELRVGKYTPWVQLRFGRVRGIARFLLTELGEEFRLYVTPVQIDPESPALPISQPGFYSAYLAKLLGPFATVGMAEDTWAFNDGAIGGEAFLEQAYSILAEREAMFANALERTKRGVVACVFDTSDRVQHMFYRDLDRDPHVIEDLYQRMDRIVGKAMTYVDEGTMLFVLSDHGFCHFRRALNLNTWLCRNGYLTVKDGEIEWSGTRAYCLGLSGLYLNLKGRESEGVVSPGAEAEALKRDLIGKLSGLRDEERNEVAIRQAYATSRLYRGPYLDAAPDLIIGYNEGYRISWDAALGKVSESVIEDNPKAWSGDHCVDPSLVPGVLFSSRKMDRADPGIEDMAPTALALFGIDTPAWMDGVPVFGAI